MTRDDLFDTLVAALTVATGAFAVVAAARPQSLTGEEPVTPGQRYYAQMYAARAVPLAVAGLATVAAARGGTDAANDAARGAGDGWGAAAGAVLGTAAAAQLADAAIGVAYGRRPQMVAPLVAAAAFAVRARIRRP